MISCNNQSYRRAKQKAQLVMIAIIIVFIESFIRNQAIVISTTDFTDIPYIDIRTETIAITPTTTTPTIATTTIATTTTATTTITTTTIATTTITTTAIATAATATATTTTTTTTRTTTTKATTTTTTTTKTTITTKTTMAITPITITIPKVRQEAESTTLDSEINMPSVSSVQESMPLTRSAEKPRSVIVIVLLVISALIMITSLAMILLVKFGVILQQPIQSTSRHEQ
ncbi:putative integral membrane protein [Acanthocheilonema viteae]